MSGAMARQHYFLTAEDAEGAETTTYGLWRTRNRSRRLCPMFLPFSAFSATSAVRSRVVGPARKIGAAILAATLPALSAAALETDPEGKPNEDG